MGQRISSKSSRTGIVIQARMGSERLPGKILLPLGGLPVLSWVVERCRQVHSAGDVIVATTTASGDDATIDYCEKNKYPSFRGSETNVLQRYFECAKQYDFQTIVRITADCPFICPQVIETAVMKFNAHHYDYLNNSRLKKTFPRGLDVEVFSFDVLEKVNRLAKLPAEREHVTYYIYQHPQDFEIETLTASPSYYGPDLRLTIDTKEDYKLACKISDCFPAKSWQVDSRDIIAYLRKNPDLVCLNRHIQQKPVDGKII